MDAAPNTGHDNQQHRPPDLRAAPQPVGAVMIGAAIAGARAAKLVNVVFGVVYLLVFAFGLFTLGNSLNFLALNAADNGLHLALGAVLLAVGLLSDRS